MDLNYSPEENAFRQEVRNFLRQALPDSLRRKVLAGIHNDRDEQVAWQKILDKKGWLHPTGRRNMAAPAGTPYSAISSKKNTTTPARRASSPSAP